jgi:hypothetical protein
MTTSCIDRLTEKAAGVQGLPGMALIAFTCCFALPVLAATTDYPRKPIRLIVPFAPGGGFDVALRPLAHDLSQQLGQPVVVDNRGGAGGIVGTELAARAIPDGYRYWEEASACLRCPACMTSATTILESSRSPRRSAIGRTLTAVTRSICWARSSFP